LVSLSLEPEALALRKVRSEWLPYLTYQSFHDGELGITSGETSVTTIFETPFLLTRVDQKLSLSRGTGDFCGE
jgi:hypothetical protein